VIGLLFGGVLVCLAGHGLLGLFGGVWPIRRLGLLGAVSLSILSGAALLGVLTTVVAVLGGSTRPLPFLVPMLLVAAGAGLLRLLRGRASRPPGTAPGNAPPTRLADALTGLLAAGLGLRLGVLVASLPVWHYDEYATWAYRGRVLSLSGHLDSRVFLAIQELHTTLDYPLLVPALIAWSEAWAGGSTDGPARVQAAVLFAASLMVTGWALVRLAGWVAAIAGVVTEAAMPGGLSHVALLLTGDLTLVAFSVPLVLTLMLWVRTGDRVTLAGAALLAAGATSTKSEGLLFALAALLGAGVVASSSRARQQLVRASAAATATVMPWILYTRLHGIQSSFVNGRTVSLANIRRVVPLADDVALGMLSRWPGSGRLVAVLLVPAVFLACSRGHSRLVRQLAVTAGLVLVGLYAQYLVSVQGTGAGAAIYLQGHLGSTAHRVLLFPAVLCSLAVPLLAGASLRQGLERPRRGLTDPHGPGRLPAEPDRSGRASPA
jgi:hypothetical protein